MGLNCLEMSSKILGGLRWHTWLILADNLAYYFVPIYYKAFLIII